MTQLTKHAIIEAIRKNRQLRDQLKSYFIENDHFEIDETEINARNEYIELLPKYENYHKRCYLLRDARRAMLSLKSDYSTDDIDSTAVEDIDDDGKEYDDDVANKISFYAELRPLDDDDEDIIDYSEDEKYHSSDDDEPKPNYLLYSDDILNILREYACSNRFYEKYGDKDDNDE